MREVLLRLNEKKVELEEDVAVLEADLAKARTRLELIQELIDEEMETETVEVDNGLVGILH